MKLTIKLLIVNAAIAAIFLLYLCCLDLWFVAVRDQQQSAAIKLGYLIVLMPPLAAIVTFLCTRNKMSLCASALISFVSFVTMIAVAFVEYLWVATRFHTMIGGTI